MKRNVRTNPHSTFKITPPTGRPEFKKGRITQVVSCSIAQRAPPKVTLPRLKFMENKLAD